MKKRILILISCFCVVLSSFAQEWMTSLSAAKRLAMVQNKMILMMWEGSMNYPLPVLITDERGKNYYVRNLFESIPANEFIWEYFVPVSLSENNYDDIYNALKGNRNQAYLDKFNDDSIKVLDAAGNILNVGFTPWSILNLSDFTKKYGLDTSFISAELKNYNKEKDFYSAYFLASRYLDYAVLTNKSIRQKVIGLSEIYMEEARKLLETSNLEDSAVLAQRAELLELYANLIKNRPRKVLRVLKRLEEDGIAEANTAKATFLRFGANLLLRNNEEIQELKDSVSKIDLKKAELISNIHGN